MTDQDPYLISLPDVPMLNVVNTTLPVRPGKYFVKNLCIKSSENYLGDHGAFCLDILSTHIQVNMARMVAKATAVRDGLVRMEVCFFLNRSDSSYRSWPTWTTG